jgi:hypothetical protein
MRRSSRVFVGDSGIRNPSRPPQDIQQALSIRDKKPTVRSAARPISDLCFSIQSYVAAGDSPQIQSARSNTTLICFEHSVQSRSLASASSGYPTIQ